VQSSFAETYSRLPQINIKANEVLTFMVCILLCVIQKKYNGTVYTTMILKKIKYTLLCQHFFLLVVDGDAACFDPFLGSSSGVQEYKNS
jgi:hypothetical protein